MTVRALLSPTFGDPAATRPDVVRARSRMRTKHGGREAIAWLNDHLEADDVLVQLVRTREVAGSTTSGPGVLGLTERHLVHVPDTLRADAGLRVPLTDLVAVGWTRGRRVGDLTAATRRSTWEFRQLAAGDLRELVEALRLHAPGPATDGLLSPVG